MLLMSQDPEWILVSASRPHHYHQCLPKFFSSCEIKTKDKIKGCIKVKRREEVGEERRKMRQLAKQEKEDSLITNRYLEENKTFPLQS